MVKKKGKKIQLPPKKGSNCCVFLCTNFTSMYMKGCRVFSATQDWVDGGVRSCMSGEK